VRGLTAGPADSGGPGKINSVAFAENRGGEENNTARLAGPASAGLGPEGTAMFTSRMVVREAGYGLACVLAAVVLVVAGYAHEVVGRVRDTGRGIAINGSPTVGAMNILLMGLESRTNFEGQTLSAEQLMETHSGNVESVSAGEVGAQDTDTLILIHIFPGGRKAVGFSIPRDDLVTYPSATYLGITQGKIDQAYDFAYNQSLQQTYGSSMSQNERYLKANQAGQAFEIATVEAVTGVHVDHFVEANLIGFYTLAQVFGGIEVCVKPWSGNDGANLQDSASGWDALNDGYNLRKGGAQYLHLAAPQALAFVRARDTLPGVDVGRTKRQQAVIDFVVWKLKHEGAFTDLGLLNELLGVASQYLITDSTFDPFDFVTNMRALTGSNLSFQTLPFSGQVNDMQLNGSAQDVNTIDVPYIQQYVKNTFYPPPAVKKTKKTSSASASGPAPAPSTVTVDVYNGSGVDGLAGDTSQALVGLGYQAGAIANASAQSQTVQPGTQVFYSDGASANAAKIAAKFGATATALTSLPAGHVEVLLGSTVTAVPASLTSPSASTSAAGAATASPSSAASGNDGETGGAVTVTANAKYGIPCVY
jgi:LCP family protein required for cell wall assembly